MDSIRRSGILLARAWPEPNACGGVRVRVMWSTVVMPGISPAASGIIVVQARDDLFAVVTGWLGRVGDAPEANSPSAGN